MRTPAKRFLARLSVAILLLNLALSSAFLAPVQAGVINWRIAGPEGGKVNCFVSETVAGEVIYSGGEGGWMPATTGSFWPTPPPR
jgi:hypothetical protein